MLVLSRYVGERLLVGALELEIVSVSGAGALARLSDRRELVLLKRDEWVDLPHGTRVKLTDGKERRVRLAFDAPRDVTIMRAELLS